MAQVSLRYVLSNLNITCAIPGMMELNELNENLQVGRQPRKLTIEEIKALMECVGEEGKGFCRNCGYCLPCPEGIRIPDIFRFESYHDRYNLKEWAREQYRSLVVKADACSGCEQCLELCPYGVSVIAQNIMNFKLLFLWSMDIFFLTTKGLMLLCRLKMQIKAGDLP